MDKLPPYPFGPMNQLEKDITDKISTRLPTHVLDVAADIQHQLQSYEQHVLMSARSMGKSVAPSDVYLSRLRHGFYDTEGRYDPGVFVTKLNIEFKSEQFSTLNNENLDNFAKRAIHVLVNRPKKGEW